ncbi:MAG: hypothetical protein K2Q01_08230 [Rickettsiales bacterium]|nr:hypothetical protein [Rickettsiales bacterium]
MYRKKPASPRMRIIGVATIAASIAVILTVGREPVTPEYVEESLKRFSDYVATDAAASGKQGSFTHGPVEMQGWAYGRHARVPDVTLEIKKQTLLDVVSWSLSTPEMTVEPDQVMAHRLYYVFEQPISINKNGSTVATISFPEPLKYGQLEMPRGDSRVLVQNFKLPSRISILPSATPNEQVVLAYAKNPVVEITSGLDKPSRHAEYQFKDITVTSGEEKPLAMTALNSELTEKPDDKGEITGHYLLAIDDMQTAATAKPCDINADITYEGAQPIMKLAGLVASTGKNAVNLQALSLDCADYKMALTGTLARIGEDPLPSGNVTLRLEQVANLLKSDLLAAQTKELLAQALVKITGQPVDALTNVDIPMKREQGGTFYIGDVTFEELAASLFANMFEYKGAASMPQAAPSSETPPETNMESPASPLLNQMPPDILNHGEAPMDDIPAEPTLD